MPPKHLTNATLPKVNHTSLVTAQGKSDGQRPTRTVLKPLVKTPPLKTRPVMPLSGPAYGSARGQARRAINEQTSGMAHLLSRNWAGAVAPATEGRRFSLITASWEVPDVAHPNGVDHSYVSIWIGLGGSYRASHSMPQMGSEHGWDGVAGRPVNRLWCQWWLGPDNSLGYLSDLFAEDQAQLKAGDTVTCWLEVDDLATTVTYHWRWTSKITGKTQSFSAWDNRGVKVTADSANWIVERPTEVITNSGKPSCYELGRHHPLPVIRTTDGNELDSGKVAITMKDCWARLGPAGPSELVRQPLHGQLLSLRSTVPGTSRSFVELEPAVPVDPNVNELHVARHLP